MTRKLFAFLVAALMFIGIATAQQQAAPGVDPHLLGHKFKNGGTKYFIGTTYTFDRAGPDGTLYGTAQVIACGGACVTNWPISPDGTVTATIDQSGTISITWKAGQYTQSGGISTGMGGKLRLNQAGDALESVGEFTLNGGQATELKMPRE